VEEILVPTQCDYNRNLGIEPRCDLEQLSGRSWIGVLYPEVQDWFTNQGLPIPEGRVKSYRHVTFKMPRKVARIFTQVWL